MATAKPWLGLARPQRDCLVVSGKGFFMASQMGQQMTEPWSDQVGFECQRLVVGGKGIIMTPQPRQRVATTKPRLGQIRLQSERLLEVPLGLGRLPAIHRAYGVLECFFDGAHDGFL